MGFYNQLASLIKLPLNQQPVKIWIIQKPFDNRAQKSLRPCGVVALCRANRLVASETMGGNPRHFAAICNIV